MTTRIVVNPAAGAGRCARRLAAVQPLLEQAFGPLERVVSQSADDVARRVREAAERGDPRVLVAGGDGTAHHAARALAGTGVALGILPAGTGNDIAASVGVPGDLRAAARVLAQDVAVSVDLGEVDTGASGGRRVFCCVLGLGMDAAALARIDGARLLRRGRLLYTLAALEALWTYPADQVTVRAGEARWSGPAMLVAVANTPTYAGGFRIAPAADPGDGCLDLALFPHASRPAMLRRFARIARGAQVGDVVRAQAAQVEVACARPLPLTLDGERTDLVALPARSLIVRALPGALRLLGARRVSVVPSSVVHPASAGVACAPPPPARRPSALAG